MILPITVPLMAMRPAWTSPSICALSPTISSFLVMILPLKRPSMRIVSSNSSSPRNDEPRSRKPFSSPLLFFISPPVLPSPSHQFIDDANQFVFAAVADVNHSSAPPAIDLYFCSQSSLQFVFRVAREDVLLFLFL